MKKIVFLLLLSLIFVGSIYSQAVIPLMVAPARQQASFDPGQSGVLNVRFYNRGEQPISGTLKVADFIVDNAQGVPKIIDNPNQTSVRFSAQSWVILPYEQATINPYDKISFQVNIKVPLDAHPGGHYLAVYFEPNNSLLQNNSPVKQTGVKTASRLAALIYLKVNGLVQEKALISHFYSPVFLEHGPIKVDIQILNRGDYHIAPRGVITVTDTFNRFVDQSKLQKENIFPDMVRNYQSSFGKRWLLGKYKINLTASYGEKGQILDQFIYVWVFPWKIVLALILMIAILIFFGLNRSGYKKI